jgi:putative endonuclease
MNLQTSVGFKAEIATSTVSQFPCNDKLRLCMGNKQYCVYILTNSRHTVLYTGVTNNLERRVLEHKSNQGNTFTKRYNVDQLVYYECGDDINTAIAREKQIKAGSRQDKINLINSINPDWKDLSKEFWK